MPDATSGEVGVVAALVAPRIVVAPSEEDMACRSRLAALGVTYEPTSGVTFAGACSVVGPITVSSLGSGMNLTPEAMMNCRTTEALAVWLRDVVVPAAQKHLNARPTGVTHASTYVCRPRNNQAGAKLSEHATGNAVDIASISFAGREPLEIQARGPDDDAERAFQAEIRKGACAYFTTVLGPGSDAAHATHFHLDMAQRRGGFRLCQ